MIKNVLISTIKLIEKIIVFVLINFLNILSILIIKNKDTYLKKLKEKCVPKEEIKKLYDSVKNLLDKSLGCMNGKIICNFVMLLKILEEAQKD